MMFRKLYVGLSLFLIVTMVAGFAMAHNPINANVVRILSNDEKAGLYGGCDRCYLLTLCSDTPCASDCVTTCSDRYWQESCAHCGYSADPEKTPCTPGDDDKCGDQRHCLCTDGNCYEIGVVFACTTVKHCS